MEIEDYGNSSLGSAAFAFLAGCIVGAGAALLLAPQSGKETRDMLKNYAKDAEDMAREKAKAAQETFQSAVDQGKQYISEKKAILTSAAEAGSEAFKKERGGMSQGDRSY
jgi:gas vesicle protein